MKKHYVLTLDCGTQSMRGLIYNSDGELVAKAKKNYPRHFSLENNWVEWDADIFWESACHVLQELKKDHRAIIDQVEGISVTCQRSTTVFVDKNGKPLRNAISWMDTRETENVKPISLKYRALFSVAGATGMIDKARKRSHVYWLMDKHPEIWDQTHKVLLLSAYLNFKLTGEYNDSKASTVGALPFDFKAQQWGGHGNLYNELFGFDHARLYTLKDSGEILGKVTTECSAETGLSEGLPVIASGSDKACETLGVGCIDSATGSVSLASMASIETTIEKYNSDMNVSKFASAIPGKYNPEININRGFWLVSWFEKEFALKETLEAEKLGVAPVELLNQRLKEIPPGSEGLVLQPFWGQDARYPHAKGSIIGFDDVHTRVHIYRALVEGLGYTLLDGINLIENKCGCKIKNIALSGGGSVSNEICQILSNIFNRDVYRVQTHETSGLGASICTLVGLGVYDTYEVAIKKMVHKTAVFSPEPETVRKYENLFNTIYTKIYGRLSPLYKAMAL